MKNYSLCRFFVNYFSANLYNLILWGLKLIPSNIKALMNYLSNRPIELSYEVLYS